MRAKFFTGVLILAAFVAGSQATEYRFCAELEEYKADFQINLCE